MKELLESLWMEGWYSCDGAGDDTPNINIEEYKEQIDNAIKQYIQQMLEKENVVSFTFYNNKKK